MRDAVPGLLYFSCSTHDSPDKLVTPGLQDFRKLIPPCKVFLGLRVSETTGQFEFVCAELCTLDLLSVNPTGPTNVGLSDVIDPPTGVGLC